MHCEFKKLAIFWPLSFCELDDSFSFHRYLCFALGSEEHRGRFCSHNEIPLNVNIRLFCENIHLTLWLRFLTAARLSCSQQTTSKPVNIHESQNVILPRHFCAMNMMSFKALMPRFYFAS